MTDGWRWGDTSGLFGDDNDAEDNGAEQESRWAGKDSLILVIDASREMFHESDGSIPFQLCIKCCVSVLKNKIISSDKDLVGIVFFGTEKQKDTFGSDFKHVYVYQELDMPDAERILDLEKFLEDDSCGDFANTFGHKAGFSLNDVFWTCSTMFSKSSQKVGHKRVMLFTNNDNPHADDPALQRQAKTKAMDLSEIGIMIELMHIKPAGQTFDASLFYQDLICMDEDEFAALPDPAEKIDELLARVQKKDHKKRSLARLPLILGDGVELGVSVFNLCRSATKSSFVNLNSRTNDEVKTITKYVCVLPPCSEKEPPSASEKYTRSSHQGCSKDTGVELMPTDLKYYQMFGGEKVIFEKDEVASMKNFGDQGLLLMGFKPKSSLKRYYHIKPAHFIYPDEKTVSGSTSLFSALLSRSLAREVVPICRYISRVGAAPRFVALVPQEEQLDAHRMQTAPPGFHVISLPYSDDLRKLKYEETPRAKSDQVNKAKDIIKKLTFPFNSSSFENPSIQKHYKNLEALALDRDAPDEVQDFTEPNVEKIDRRAGDLMQEFKELVFPSDYNPDGKPAAKRKAPGTAATAAKRSRAGDQTEVDIKEEAINNRLSKLTVPVLKDFIKQTGLKCGTKKADLIAAINKHFGL